MQVTASQIWTAIEAIREKSPVIHNITNFVVMNNTANALLALGASPVMAHAEEEVEEMVDIAGALVINIGTLSRYWIPSMLRAVQHAHQRKIPIVLDPVGAGATAYRTRTSRELLETVPITIIRGNASEIMALVNSGGKTKGVDSSALSEDALDAARRLHDTYGSVVCVSGETDYILAGADVTKVFNGHIMMTKVTGLGCTASALCGAFAAVNGNFAQATTEAMAVMGIAGELSAMNSPGPGSMQVNFLDALYRLSEENINKLLRIEG
ncbi:MAG: hydroxyethylthiazole kinase [Deltaproteobacteria bacterium]|nr:hydroxyethylthiazole kinase [Deltaproteobacteria bacterium]